MTMRLGLTTAGADGPALIALVREAERLGFDSTWCGESYGVDAVTRLAWLGGQTTRIKLGASILQVPARAPAMTAMTAMTLDQLSGGRFILGLGPSGPQVIEGWYGVPYGKPLTRMREYIAIVRAVLAREAPLTTRASTTRFRTQVQARPGSASRSDVSCTAGATCRSTRRRSARPASHSPAKSPTACSRS